MGSGHHSDGKRNFTSLRDYGLGILVTRCASVRMVDGLALARRECFLMMHLVGQDRPGSEPIDSTDPVQRTSCSMNRQERGIKTG